MINWRRYDQLETFDLAVTALDDNCHVAHQAVQESRINWQIVEIDSHVRFYYESLLNLSGFTSIHWGFDAISACNRRSPHALGRTPV